MIFCLVYESWAFPFRLAFCSPSSATSVFIMDITVDCIFLGDVFLVALSRIYHRLVDCSGASSSSSVKTEVSLQAVKVEFPTTMACLLVYFLASLFTSAHLGTIASDRNADWIDLDITVYHWIWWVSTVPRTFLRGRRLYVRGAAADGELSRNIHVEEAKKIAMSTVLIAHWVGCLFFFMSRLRGLDRRTWVSSIEDTLVVYSRFESPLREQYALALWKGFSSISSVEFTSYLANNAEEQVAGVLMIMVQVYISSLILGTIIHYLALKGRPPRPPRSLSRHSNLGIAAAGAPDELCRAAAAAACRPDGGAGGGAAAGSAAVRPAAPAAGGPRGEAGPGPRVPPEPDHHRPGGPAAVPLPGGQGGP